MSLRYPTAARVQTVDGTLTMDAKATQALSRFNLDFDGKSVSAVSVNGRPAGFAVQGEELVITPAGAIRDGKKFSTTIGYTSGAVPLHDEALYADRRFGVSRLDRLHTFYELGNHYRADFGPVALPSHSDFLNLFSDNVYNGGMLVLYALYQRVGEKTFYEIERKWAQRNRGESVSTDDFIAHAAKVAQDRGVVPFLREWVYGTTIPPMPGHPDWTAAPASAVGASASAARISARGLENARLLKR